MTGRLKPGVPPDETDAKTRFARLLRRHIDASGNRLGRKEVVALMAEAGLIEATRRPNKRMNKTTKHERKV